MMKWNPNKKILIISPHPDDEAICCGGLIMKAKKEGGQVFVLYMSIGSSRQFINGATTTDDRLKEVEKASSCGSFDYNVLSNKATLVDMVAQKDLIEAIEDT